MPNNKEKATIAIKKAHSSLAKVITMLEEEKYCIDVIQQNLAVIGLVKSANLQLLEGHLNHCVKNAAQKKDTKRLNQMIQELLKVVKTAQNK